MQAITNDTPLSALTVGQLKEILRPKVFIDELGDKGEHYVYGLRGIRQLFGVSHATAQHYKDTFLRPAVRQHGRKIMVDIDLALELFNKKTGGRR